MNILAIGAHPDDIEYGCGGTLLKCSRRGHDIYLYVATAGDFGGDPSVRMKEQEASAKKIGARHIFWGGYKDTQIPMSQDLIASLEEVVRQVEPDFIFVHYPDDTHQDHRTLAQATITATRYTRNFLFYEGLTTQNFNPSVYVDIEETLEDKFELLRLHRSQVTKTNIADMTVLELAKSTANFRGIQGRVKYAEAFCPSRLFIII
ncbi:MAG: PIG-L family deacetylase [Candidatus Latescibacterota bacterium]|nr:MAG: PIG-L family deacetylase [Candidatus Latescibacterota bacterium]RKY73492.1 MAG: PIG-L family deacetylase [Candidatus Latescibacterota bacterium]HDI00122.1 PIG-L family deacetylase [Bacillota bacterium]